jgi:dynein heavy chain, axonemal
VAPVSLQPYTTLAKDMEKNSDEWEKWCNQEAPEKAPMPGEWGKLGDFRQLLVIRALKPGRITNALQVSPAITHSRAYTDSD